MCFLSSSSHTGLKPLLLTSLSRRGRKQDRSLRCGQENCEILALLLLPPRILLPHNWPSLEMDELGFTEIQLLHRREGTKLQQRRILEPFRRMWVEFTASPKHPNGLLQRSDWQPVCSAVTEPTSPRVSAILIKPFKIFTFTSSPFLHFAAFLHTHWPTEWPQEAEESQSCLKQELNHWHFLYFCRYTELTLLRAEREPKWRNLSQQSFNLTQFLIKTSLMVFFFFHICLVLRGSLLGIKERRGFLVKILEYRRPDHKQGEGGFLVWEIVFFLLRIMKEGFLDGKQKIKGESYFRSNTKNIPS